MNTQSIYQNIGDFLSESSEWVERWLNSPVKKAINPLMIPELVSNVLKFLPYDDYYRCSKINRTWYKEANFEYGRRMKLLKSLLSLEDIEIFYRNNPTWMKEVNITLHSMRDAHRQNYWDTVNEYVDAGKEYYACFSHPYPGVIGPPIRDATECFNKYMELNDKKFDAFFKQVYVEEYIMKLNLETDSERNRYRYHTRLILDNLDPYGVGLNEDSDMPDDSDSSVDSNSSVDSDTPDDFFEEFEWDPYIENWN